jgi:hypothetical protein
VIDENGAEEKIMEILNIILMSAGAVLLALLPMLGPSSRLH